MNYTWYENVLMFLHSVHEYEFLFTYAKECRKPHQSSQLTLNVLRPACIIKSYSVMDSGFLKLGFWDQLSMEVTGWMQDEQGFSSFLPFLMKFQTSYENGKKLTLEKSITTLNLKKYTHVFMQQELCFYYFSTKNSFQVWVKDPPAHIYEQFVNV